MSLFHTLASHRAGRGLPSPPRASPAALRCRRAAPASWRDRGLHASHQLAESRREPASAENVRAAPGKDGERGVSGPGGAGGHRRDPSPGGAVGITYLSSAGVWGPGGSGKVGRERRWRQR